MWDAGKSLSNNTEQLLHIMLPQWCMYSKWWVIAKRQTANIAHDLMSICFGNCLSVGTY